MDGVEVVFHPSDMHAFFFGKAIDIALASNTVGDLSRYVNDVNFYAYVGATARALHIEYENSLEALRERRNPNG